MAQSVGYASLQIIPVLQGLQGNLQAQLGNDLVGAGNDLGRRTGRAIADGIDQSSDDVSRATRDLSGAVDEGSASSGRFGDSLERAGARASAAGEKVNGFASSIQGYALGAGAALGALGMQAFNLASDFEQATGAVESVFGEASGQIMQLSEDAATSVGLAKGEYASMAAVLGASLKNMGISQDQLSGTTSNLISTGADMAAMFGGTTADAVDALGAALRGETDPLERYGISIKQATVDAAMAERGLDNLEGSAADLARTQTLLSLITEQAGPALGTFSREADTSAGSMQIMKAELSNTATELGAALLPAVSAVAGKLGDLASWLGENQTVAYVLVGAVGALVATWATAKVVAFALQAGTMAMTGAQWALNAAMAANPIGLIIAAVVALGAGLVLAYKKSETFRNIVQGAWEGIKTAVSAAWTGFIQPVVNALVTGFQWIGDKASWLWTTVIQPVFGFIGNAAQVLMAVVGTVLITPFILAWNSIGAIVQTVWNTVLSPLWELMKAGLGLLGDAFSFYWNNVVKPVWDAFGAGIQWVWANVVSPVWDALKAGLGLVQDAFSWAWNNVIKPVWDALGAGIKFVWDNVISPVWEALKTGLDTLKSSFDTAVGFIGQVWDRIKGIVAAPVRFVVETVYNNGIREAWNKVAGFLGLGNLEPVDLGLLGAYAAGGIIPGYTPGKDTGLIAVGGGEAVMRPEWTRAMGSDYIDGANAAARMGGVSAVKKFMGAYANGGIVESIVGLVNENFPGMSITSTYRDTPDHHGAGKAVDFSDGTDSTPGMQAAAQWFYDNYGGTLLELIHSPFANNVKDGQNVGDGFGFYGAGTMAAHRNHVHVASPVPLDPSIAGQMDPSLWDRVKGAVSGAVQSLRSVVARLFDSVMDPIGGAIPSFGDSPIGRLPKAGFDKFRTSVRDWILGEADKKGGSSGGSFAVAPGTGPVADQVREAFAAYGWGDGPQWDAANWIIGKESSWNPTARNPDSGAFGLFQFLGGTKDKYLPDENPNPKIQGDAGARYMRDRYGDPLGAKAFWEKNGWYDQGGLATGAGLMLKKVIQPERVLAPEMTKHFERLVDVMEKPEFIDALKMVAPAQSDPAAASSIPAPQPIPSISSTSPATSSSSPIGGTGVDEQYTQEDKWGEWQKNASDRSAKAGQAFFEGQLEGMPFGNHLRAMRDRGSQINVIVQDMYEAIEKLRQEERRRTMASGSRF